MSMSFSTSSSLIMLKNGAASVISSSDTVGEEGRSFEGVVYWRFLPFRGRSFEGAFIQSITVIRTCFSFWIFYVFQCNLFPIQIKLFVYLNYLSFKKWGIFWNQLINSFSIYWERNSVYLAPLLILLIIFLLRFISLKILRLCNP